MASTTADDAARKRPRMLYDLRASEREAEAAPNQALVSYYTAQVVIASDAAADKATMAQSLDLLRRPLPLTFRLNKSSYQGGSEAARKLSRALGGRLQPIPWMPDQTGWMVVDADAADAGADASTPRGGRGADASTPDGWTLDKDTVTELLIRAQKSGELSQQELVSMLPALALSPSSDHAVLDLCAAPGSKTIQLLDMMHWDLLEEGGGDGGGGRGAFTPRHLPPSKLPRGVLVANDSSSNRLSRIVDRASAQPCSPLLTCVGDARELPALQVAAPVDTPGGSRAFPRLKFDRVLCDVPCSGDGALRKMPDAMGAWSAREALAVHPLQLGILKRGLELLAPGGRLVYSTCSMNPVENEAVVAAALKEARDSGVRAVLLPPPAQLVAVPHGKGWETWGVPTSEFGGSGADADNTLYRRHDDLPPYEDRKGRSPALVTMFPPDDPAIRSELKKCVRMLPAHANCGGFFLAVFSKETASGMPEQPW